MTEMDQHKKKGGVSRVFLCGNCKNNSKINIVCSVTRKYGGEMFELVRYYLQK